MERANRQRNKKGNKARKAPKVPIKTYRWEDIRRSRRRGGYPWTYLYKRPYNEKVDPEQFTMDALRRSKSASTMGARSDGVEFSDVSSFAESGKTTPSFLQVEIVTEPSDEALNKEGRAGSETIEEFVEDNETKDLEDDVQVREFRAPSIASSGNISQYLEKEDRSPANSNTNEENGIDDDKKQEAREQRARSEETAQRKRKLSAESGHSRYSLSKLGVIKKLRDAKSKIKVPKLAFPTKKIFKKKKSPPKEIKTESKSKKEKSPPKEISKSKKEETQKVESTTRRKNVKPLYIYIPLKPPPGETDEFSHLEFESKNKDDNNELDASQRLSEDKSSVLDDETVKENEKLETNNEKDSVMIMESKQEDKDDKEKSKSKTSSPGLETNKENDSAINIESKQEDKDDKEKSKSKTKSPFGSLERGPKVTRKPPLVINPAFKQLLKDVRQLKEKEAIEEQKENQAPEQAKAEPNVTATPSKDATKSKEPNLDDEEHLDLDEQQLSDSESPKEDEFDKLFEARASKKDVPSTSAKSTPSESSRNVRSKSAEPERKRRSSIESSYSRKSLSKLGIMKKLKEASEKIKKTFSLSSLKRSDSKKVQLKDKTKKDDSKDEKIKKPKLSAQEKMAQFGKPKHVEPVYIHIPLKPPSGEEDEFSHLEAESASITIAADAKKEERTDSLDSASPLIKNNDIQFIFLTPPSDDEHLDDKDSDIPETPSSEDTPVIIGSLKKLAEHVVDEFSPETKRNLLETVREESSSDKGSIAETESLGKKETEQEESQSNKEDPTIQKSSEEPLSQDPVKDESTMIETSRQEPEQMVVDVEDGLNEVPKQEELKSVLKTPECPSSPTLKKKVSFKRKAIVTKVKTDVDNGYEAIEVPKEEQTVNLLQQAGVDVENKYKRDIIPPPKGERKKIFFISKSMSVDDEKGDLDEKIVKDTSLEDDFSKWSKAGDHEYEPVNPPEEVTLMTSSFIPGVTVIDSNDEPKVVISATDILDKPLDEKRKPFFQFGRFNNKEKRQEVEKAQDHGSSNGERSRSSVGRESSEGSEKEKASEGPNKFQVAFKHRTDQLKSKTNELRNKVRNIKKPNIHMPKAPEFKKPQFQKPDFKKFKIKKPKINLHLPKIPDTATIHFPNISIPGAKKTTEKRTVETRQYSTESTAGDSGSPKPKSKFDFNFSTFPRFKKKKSANREEVAFGTAPRAKKNKEEDKRTNESTASSSIRIPLHSEDSLDTDNRLEYEREHELVRSSYEDRETSADIDRSSRMRFDQRDIAIDDEYERENQEINRAEYLNRWQHGNLRPTGRREREDDEGEEFSNEEEKIVGQLVEERFKRVGPGYNEEKQLAENYERYDDHHNETLDERLRKDEDRPHYIDDEEEFERRQNKDLITDLDNLEDDEGIRVKDGYSSEGSENLHRRGRLGKLDIDSDEFFVVHEIREGFQTPANALAQMNEYDPIGSNRSLPEAPLKKKPIKKPKRKKTPHVSQEKIPGDEEWMEGVVLPSKPKRKSKKNKKKLDTEDGVVPYQKTIHLEHEDSPRGQRLDFPRESLGILGDDERDDQEFEMYENEKMKGIEQPEIMVSHPYKDFQAMEQKMRAREEADSKYSEPSPPPRRNRSMKSLSQSENESLLMDQPSDSINIEDYIIPAHQFQAPPPRPSRRSRSHTSSLSRVSLPPSQRDTDSIMTDEAFMTENQPIPSYLIENQSYRQQNKDIQEMSPYLQDQTFQSPCVEEPCVQDLRDYMGYSIVDKSKQRDPPLPPPRTPPRRRKRQIEQEQKFATVPRNVGSSQADRSPPIRPLRNYSTLGQVRSNLKEGSPYENDKENRPSETDIGQYIEIDDETNRDLISGEIVQKMRQRPLPAPPRPPRKTKSTRKSLQDITSKENIMPSSSYSVPQKDIKQHLVEEETVSTQTEPLPPDFVCEEILQEPSDTIITPRISDTLDSTTLEPNLGKKYEQPQSEPHIRRELITPSVFSYEETVTHGSLIVEPIDGAKVVPDHQLSRERLVPITRCSDDETSEIPDSFRKLKSPEEVRKPERRHWDSEQASVEVLKADKLQVSDLDVDRLRVNELLASKIIVSEIDSSTISTNEIQGISGPLKVGEIELPPRFIEEIVRKLEEARPSEAPSGRKKDLVSEEKKTPIDEAPLESQSIPSSPVDELAETHDHQDYAHPEHREYQKEDNADSLQHELSPEPPAPPPRSYVLEDSPPDAPPRTLRGKSKDSIRTTDHETSDQQDQNVPLKKTELPTAPQNPSRMEMLEPEVDDQPPPRPPEPIEGLYMPSQPPASFYELRAKQYVGLETENIPTAPRRKRRQVSRSRPVSRSRSTSDDSSLVQSQPQARSPRTSRRFSEPSIPELSGRLIQACGSRINNSLKRLIYHLTENILRNADGRQDLHVVLIILLVLIAGLILLGYGEDRTVVHLHHWEYFNPPKDL